MTTTVDAEVKALWEMDKAALRARYVQLFGKDPRVNNAAWVTRRVAWELQAQALGGLSATARRRIDELNAELKLPLAERTVTDKVKRRQEQYGLSPGTTIVKHWHGRDLVLRVIDGGVEVDGQRYGSLTAAAKGVTGTHWNGALFWGVKTRRKTS